MTMFVDRRKDNYDELLVLATDARLRRARTNRWTTGLIVTAMLGTAAYIAAMTHQVEEMRDTAEDAQGQRDLAVRAYQELLDSHASLQARVDAFQDYKDSYEKIFESNELSTAIAGIRGGAVGSGAPASTSSVTQHTIAKTNIVWMVDGSRRFPMIDGDILWVPEGDFWIHLVKEDDERKLYKENSPGGSGASRKVLLSQLPYREEVTKGAHTCIEIKLHDESLRPLFRAKGYVDVEVTYFSPGVGETCR